ncbi:helix-turn-helix domain-containing protein [Streptosporangium sp. NPDC020072]|uniref:TetR/AcrR family transcriptional regulator n=1 Tax=Streptosporangium sp. NPDC020072 TaxID=3154788 RepID=UPI00343A33B0
MGRPSQHDVDRLLDAAVRLAAQSGPGSVTMAAVAREAGAPSGSVYHRFPSRAALLAALWLRTVGRFQEGFLAATHEEPPERAVMAAAGHVVAWSRANPLQARVLLYGPADFGESDWPRDARERLRTGNRRIEEALVALARRLGPGTPPEVERLVLATVDLPYATVRRHHQAGGAIPAHAEDLVARCAGLLLAQPVTGG